MRKSASENGFFETISSGLSKAIESLGTFILSLKERVKNILEHISNLNIDPFFYGISGGFKSVYNLLKPIFAGIGEVIGSVIMDTFYNVLKGGFVVQVVKML